MENPASDLGNNSKSHDLNRQSTIEADKESLKTATESLPGSAEISLRRIYQDTWSNSGTDSQDESGPFPDRIASKYLLNDTMSESQEKPVNDSNIGENCRSSENKATDPMVFGTTEMVKPYSTSKVTVIDQCALESVYQNPYLNIYESIDCVEESTDVKEETHVHISDSTTSPNLSRSQSSKSPGIYTRQLNMFIGEELEAMPWPADRKALSCPGTLRATPLPTRHFTRLSTDNRRMEMLRQQVTCEPPSYLPYLDDTPEETPIPKHYIIQPNPYNRINHMIHSALHCPCFFFFYLLCCLPGVHYMQLGDLEYRTGHEDRAKKFGCIATALYIIGAVVGTITLATLVVLSVNFVQLQVQ